MQMSSLGIEDLNHAYRDASKRRSRNSFLLTRNTLLASVATVSILLSANGVARAQVVPGSGGCSSTAGTTVNCSGNLSSGVSIRYADNFTVVNVTAPAANITPASGVDGIKFFRNAMSPVSNSPITITSNTGSSIISVTGDGADGIEATGFGAIKIDSTGNITSANGRGIAAMGSGNASLVEIISQGSISASSVGLSANGGSGGVRIETKQSDGASIRANGTGIFAATTLNGNVTIINRTSIAQAVTGISGSTNGSIDITNRGAITVNVTGISAVGGSSGTAATTNVKNYAQIQAGTGAGIDALQRQGDVSIYNRAAVSASTFGLKAVSDSPFAGGSGVADVDSVGNIIALSGTGISAQGATGAEITSVGNIHATDKGIFAFSTVGTITVRSTGDIKGKGTIGQPDFIADPAFGIYADNNNLGANIIDIESTGAIKAVQIGILARNDGSTGLAQVKTLGASSITSGGTGIDVSGTGDTDVSNVADITAVAGYGIFSRSFDGSARLISTGADISAGKDGLLADGETVVELRLLGGSITAGGTGLFAASQNGLVTVEQTGEITAGGTGIDAGSNSGGISVAANARINARSGIAAQSVSGPVEVTGQADVTAAETAIFAESQEGAVTVNVTGAISSSAAGRGIDARSAFTGAGPVSVTAGGAVTAQNEGIYAQGGTGTVTVTTKSDVVSTASHAIQATGHGNLAVDLKNLKPTGVSQIIGAGGFAGVNFGDATAVDRGGLNNTLTIGQTVQVKNAANTAIVLNQLAIGGAEGSEAITNHGTVTGSVNLGGGNDSFLNSANATFVTGDTVSLGSGETLTNQGNVNIGGSANLFTTTLTGDFEQSFSGVFFVDFKPDNDPSKRASDVLVLSGNASLSGTVVASRWAGLDVTAPQEFVIMRSTGGELIDNGLGVGIAATSGYTASLEFRNVGGTNVDTLVLKFTSGGPPVTVGRYWDGGNSTATPSGDGPPKGGDGIWNSANDNWTLEDGSNNNIWPQSGTAIFSGLSSGAVTVDGNQEFGGLEFHLGGYVLTGGTLEMRPDPPLATDTFILVNPGQTATIQSEITDGTNTYRLVKTGEGDLNLIGANSFDGGVFLQAGALGVGNNTALGTGALDMLDATTLRAVEDNLTLGTLISVDGTATIDMGSFTLTLDDANTVPATTVSGPGTLNKDGVGTLVLMDDSSLAGWDLKAGAVDNRAKLVTSGTMIMSGTETTLLNAAGASVTVAGGGGAIQGAAGSQSIDNAGAIKGAVALGDDDDTYILRASGTQTGMVAGEGGTGDLLLIDAETGATRSIAEAAFTGFETVRLNQDAGSAGTIKLAAASNPASQATLDTGGGAGTSVTLTHGVLNLESANSSIRAANMTITKSAVLSGIGQVLNGAGGLTINGGTVSAGNSSPAGSVSGGGSIGLLDMTVSDGKPPPSDGVSGGGSIGRLNIAGSYLQEANGIFFVDFKPDGATANRASDVLVLTGDATLSGLVRASQWTGTVVNAEQEFVIMETSGGVITTSGLTLQLQGDLNYEGYTASLVVVDSNKLVLRFTAPDPPPPPPPRPPDEDSELRPQAYLHAAMAGVWGAEAFSDALMGCREREGTYAFITGAECIWFDAGGGYLERTASGHQVGADQTSWWLGGGVQLDVSEALQAGLGVRYENVSQNVDDNASNDGWWGHGGASLSYSPGPWLFAGAVSGGGGRIDTRRHISSDGFNGVAEGEQDLSYVHGKLRAGYLIDYGQWYLKPLLDVDVTWMSFGDVDENGGGGAALRLDAADQTVFSATPRLEIGGQWELANGAYVRPYAQLGAAIYANTGFSLDAAFEDTSLGVPSFTTVSDLDPVLADISVGLDVLAVENLNVRLSYDGLFGETTRSNAGSLRLEWRL
jgi:autotransporter-associated beta strand protein